jgi:cell division protein FtsI/penicillin-binding protein 2
VVLVERRIGLLFAFFLMLLAIAALRSLQLGTLKGGMLTRAAASQQVLQTAVPAHRGTITDRRGTELAVSEAADDVSATPYLVKDPVNAARRLAPLLGLDEAEVLKRLSRRDTGFVYLARALPGERADKIRRLGIAGIDLTPGQRRTYPRDYLASQVLGSVKLDGTGASGLEYELDAKLHGTDGERRIVRDGVGDDVSIRDLRRAQPGDRVELSLDANLQEKAEAVLQGVGRQYRPKGATAIVTNPQTGEILALANWPQINANDPSAAPGYANQDRAVGYTYEPGSTFKAITVAGALEDGKVTPDTSFNLPPQITLYDRTIKNAEDRGWATMTTSEILAKSDNVGAITIGQRLTGRRVMSAKTAAALRDMLKGVLKPGGTASLVTIPGYTLAGKTGTANKVDPITKTYSETNYIASFVGFVPADDPKLLISIMVDEPHGAIYGGEVAAPAFGQIASFALRYEKIEPR